MRPIGKGAYGYAGRFGVQQVSNSCGRKQLLSIFCRPRCIGLSGDNNALHALADALQEDPVFLRREIGGNRTVINREVGIRRTRLPGLRTDIHIDIPADESHENLRLVIECKGCWNDLWPTTGRGRLSYERSEYLFKQATRTGVVGKARAARYKRLR